MRARRVVLVPPLPMRVVLAVGAGVSGVLGLWLVVDPPPSSTPASVIVAMGLALSVLSAFLGFRGWRAGVMLFEDRIIVRGLLYSRAIRRDAVTEVLDLGFVDWRDGSGVPRETPVTGLMFRDSAAGKYRHRRADAMRLIRDWSVTGVLPAPTGL